MAWPSSLAFQWPPSASNSSKSQESDPWEREAKKPLAEHNVAARPRAVPVPKAAVPKKAAIVVAEAPPKTLHRNVRTKDFALRKVAAATNTPLFIAAARQTAAVRAARGGTLVVVPKPRAPSPPSKKWNAAPLTKLCDRDAKRAAAVERRRRELQQRNNERYAHREDAVLPPANEESYPALRDAREKIRNAKADNIFRVAAPKTLEEEEDEEVWRSKGFRRSKEVASSDTRSPLKPVLYYDLETDADCVGEARAKKISSAFMDVRTRATSPFDPSKAQRALDIFEERQQRPQKKEMLFYVNDKPQEKEPRIASRRSDVERRSSLAVVEDVSSLTRAVAGLVGSAAKTVELHEDAQRRAQQREHSLTSFHTWQARAQQHLDHSLRLQQQQIAATLADFRAAAAYGHTYYGPPPPQQQYPQYPPRQQYPQQQYQQQQQQYPQQQYQEHQQQEASPQEESGEAESRLPYVPFGGASTTLPKDDVGLVERLWEKLTEIEEDERSVVAALANGRKPPRGKETSPLREFYLPADGSNVSLPLGVVASLIVDKNDDDIVDNKKDNRKSHTEEKWQSFVPSTSPSPAEKKVDESLALDGNVDTAVALRVLDHRERARRTRKIAEADLLDSGLKQSAVVDALADELLDTLLNAATKEVDAALKDTSEAILDRA